MSVTLSGSGTIGGLVAGGLPDATVTNDELVTMDGAKVTGNIAAAQITSALNASGSAPVYACRAWVNFNGTGTVAIRASGNVSSITDNGTGDYTVNFTTAMPDANWICCPVATGAWISAASQLNTEAKVYDAVARVATSVRIKTGDSYYTASVYADNTNIDVAIFR